MMKTTGLMLASGLATLAMMQPAMALDAQAFVDRIETVYKVMGYDFSFGPATIEGDTIVVDGVTVGIVGIDGEAKTFDTTLTFTGVVEQDDGSYTADELSIPDIDEEFPSEPTQRITISNIVAQDLWLPPEGETGSEALLQTMGRFATGPVAITREDVEVFKIDAIDMTSEFTYADDDSLESIRSDVAIDNIWADFTQMGGEDSEAGEMIDSLGLSTISGNITQVMNWTMADGHLVIEEALLDFADVGALNFTMDLTGFTPDLLDKIYAQQAKGLDPMSEEAQAAEMMLGMEMAQAVSIGGASVRYDDAGLAGALLDSFADEAGVDRAQYVETLKPQVSAMIGQAGVPALTNVVVPAVNAFLDDPQSFEVVVAPPSPTSLLVLGAAAANPAAMITVLGLTITANQ